MGHHILEAILEEGQIKRVSKKLPRGKLKVRIIYETAEKKNSINKKKQIIKDTSGIYPNINVDDEAKAIRKNWERDVHG